IRQKYENYDHSNNPVPTPAGGTHRCSEERLSRSCALLPASAWAGPKVFPPLGRRRDRWRCVSLELTADGVRFFGGDHPPDDQREIPRRAVHHLFRDPCHRGQRFVSDSILIRYVRQGTGGQQSPRKAGNEEGIWASAAPVEVQGSCKRS